MVKEFLKDWFVITFIIIVNIPTLVLVFLSWWDDLFKTFPKESKITQRIIDFYFMGDENEPMHLNETFNCKSKMDSCQSGCAGKKECAEFRKSL